MRHMKKDMSGNIDFADLNYKQKTVLALVIF